MGNIFRQPCDEGVIRSRPIKVPCAAGAEPWILAATILGSSMVFIDGTVVNVALPALQKSLDATVLDEQRVRLAGADLPATIDERTRAALKQTIDESFVVFGFRLVMLTSAGLARASAFVAFRVIENR
jgi:hypothetical protein